MQFIPENTLKIGIWQLDVRLSWYEYKTTPWLYERAPAARGQGVVAFFRPIYRLKGRKNGGFRANPLAKYRRLSFFRNLFKDFRKFLYAKMRHVPLRTGAATFATLVIWAYVVL